MLGELLGEDRGKVTGHRVLPCEGRGPRVEVSFRTSGKLLGLDVVGLGTYWSVTRNGGVMYGEGQGVVMTKDGDMASWTGNGSGKFTQSGGMSWRGAIYYQTTSPKLARLNGAVAVFEHEIDANDNISDKTWEWK